MIIKIHNDEFFGFQEFGNKFRKISEDTIADIKMRTQILKCGHILRDTKNRNADRFRQIWRIFDRTKNQFSKLSEW